MFAIALPWFLLRRILRHITLLVRSPSATTPSSPATAHASDSALVVDYTYIISARSWCCDAAKKVRGQLDDIPLPILPLLCEFLLLQGTK